MYATCNNVKRRKTLPSLLTYRIIDGWTSYHSCDFDQSKSAFWQIWQQISPTRCRIPGMQVLYTYADTFVDRKNKTEFYFCASFQNSGVLKTPQAPGNATVLKRFFHDNFVSFRRRSKRISFFWSQWIFLRVSICKFSIFVIVTWPLFGTLQGSISTECLAISGSPEKQKAYLQCLGFPSVSLVWGKTASCRLCAG